jgi:hypothetical protein
LIGFPGSRAGSDVCVEAVDQYPAVSRREVAP